MGKLKTAGLIVLAVLVGIGTVFAIDQESQMDALKACVEKAGLVTTDNDFTIDYVRGDYEAPGIDVDRVNRDNHVALVSVHTDEFQASTFAEDHEDGPAENIGNVLVLPGEGSPAGLDDVRRCARATLDAGKS